MEENRNHKIILDNRESLTVSGVEDVESFDEEKVVIITEMGTMTVTGAVVDIPIFMPLVGMDKE